MLISRRTMLGGAMALAAVGPAKARRQSAASWFDRAIVIDGLGGIADPYAAEGVSRMSERAFTETMATGVTLLRDTIMPVGNVGDPWGDYQKAMADYKNFLAANPDRLVLVRGAVDIIKAKRESRFGVVVGTQDSCMVGPELDRLAQLKKDGVMSVQLTYNNRNLAGDGALEPANAGLSKLGATPTTRRSRQSPTRAGWSESISCPSFGSALRPGSRMWWRMSSMWRGSRARTMWGSAPTMV
jgi:membrane dipeptidase